MSPLRIASPVLLAAGPAFAAGDKPFFSLANTDFIVLLGFLLFVGILVYFKVPGLLGGMLDKRAAGIEAELEEARALRDEAQTLLASYEKKRKEMLAQADTIVEAAKKEAAAAATEAKQDIEASIARRMAAADEQIAQAEARAVRQVRDRAVTVAVAAAGDVLAGALGPDAAGSLVDKAIAEVGAKLH